MPGGAPQAKVVDQVAAGPPKGAQARMSKVKKESRGGKKYLIPLFIAAQWAVKKYIVDPAIDEDGVTGDQYGPFSPEEVERLRREPRAPPRSPVPRMPGHECDIRPGGFDLPEPGS